MNRARSPVLLVMALASVLLLPPAPATAAPCGAGTSPGAVANLHAFITTFYEDVLQREPSAGELDSWVAFLQANPTTDGIAMMAEGFLHGPENGGRPVTPWTHITLVYHVILGRDPSPAELNAWVSALVTRINSILPGFINSPEFQTLMVPRFKDPNQAPGAVASMYQEVLGRTPAPSEISGWVAYDLQTGDVQGIVNGFILSPEYLQTPRSIDDHVTVLYHALLSRDPDPAGLAFWGNYLVVQTEITESGIINSAEFLSRCTAMFQ